MEPFKALTASEQLAAYLRESISKGKLSGNMPGIRRLADSLGVSSNTVTAAVEQLEREGFLLPQGHGKRSRIVMPEGAPRPRFRVTLLAYERADVQADFILEIRQRLREEGHEFNVADKCLVEMKMKTDRIERLVKATKTDAWLVFSAPQEVLEWFAKHPTPTFALFGRFRQLSLAASGVDRGVALRSSIRRLAELGHRRIVMLQPAHNRFPTPALIVRESLVEMEAHGIKTGKYTLPDWEQSPTGIRKCLDSLFAVSPPTALILDRPNELIAVQQYLAQRGILAPHDVSLMCIDYDPTFEWCQPSVSCIRWESRQLVRRVTRWVNNVASGKDDRRQSFTTAKFVEKNTIGPVPGRK